MKKTIYFNDKELEVDSLKTTIKPLFGISNSLVSRANSISRRVSSFEANAKLITLYFPFQHKSNYQTIESISEFFYSDETKILINPRDETRYFLAKVEGEIDYVEEGNIVYCTVNLIAPEGMSRSIDTKTFSLITTNGNTSAEVENNGTYKTPIDINVTFTSDANSIGFVSSDRIVQLGTSFSEDDENAIASDKVMNDEMGTSTKNLWSVNVGRPRWRYDDGDNTSKVEGTLTWGSTDVTPASYGSFDTSKPGYWHGPTITRVLTETLNNFEVTHRLEFKPRGTKAQIPLCQGLIEINYSDADNNFILGFEMKDNTTISDRVTYSFFVGDFRIYKASLPTSVLNYSGGFFGSITMGKVGNKFYFRLARIDGTTWKETWSTPTKSWTNNTVAMLSASIVNSFMAQWRNYRTMSIKLTHTRITQFQTDNEALIPKTFYEGDNLFVEGETNRVYINGIRDDSYRVTGSSQFLTAEKGLTEIVAISDGSFEGNLAIRERYL